VNSRTQNSDALEMVVYGFLSIGQRLASVGSEAGSWVWLFLTTQPLLDLTWRWHFFKISEQEVNIQTVAGLLLLVVNLAIGLWGSWRMPIIGSKVCLFLAFASFSALFTFTSWGTNEVIRLLTGLSFFFTSTYVFRDESGFLRFSRWFLASLSIPILISYLELMGIVPYEYHDWIDGAEVGRVTGGYEHPLTLVYFLVYGIPCALVLLFSVNRVRSQRTLALIFLLAAFGSIIFSMHRVGLLVAVAEVLLWFILTGRKRMVAAVSGAVICAAMIFVTWIQNLYAPLVDSFGLVDPTTSQFFRGRGLNWFLFLNSLFSSHPIYWIVGKGGSVPSGWETLFNDLSPNEPHSDLIRLLHAYGFVGLVLYLSILAAFLKVAVSIRRSKSQFCMMLGTLLHLALFGILALSFTSEPSRYPSAISYLFLFGAAACMCVSEKATENGAS